MENKRLEIIEGDGSNIEMSPVLSHINSIKPKPKEKKSKVIIPETKKK
mgnify:CR=1 FL=1|nr:MAG TPA_asm: hypothetical protein [Caudoviricetes sp.]